mgnify:CR=1 FL=1
MSENEPTCLRNSTQLGDPLERQTSRSNAKTNKDVRSSVNSPARAENHNSQNLRPSAQFAGNPKSTLERPLLRSSGGKKFQILG